MSLVISPAQGPDDLDHIRTLFVEYQDWLNVDLCFQGFQAELDSLPGKYDCLLLARWDGQVCGCVGVWPVAKDATCEMKRLYVRPAFQGHGIGRKLAECIIEQAREKGYLHMCLDTLQHLEKALTLYETMSFRRCAPYYDNPLDKVVYLEKTL